MGNNKLEAERPLKEETPTAEDDAPPFTTFSVNQKRFIVGLSALAATFSPLSSFIFYPAITAMADGLHVSVKLINLAVTTYMVVSGVVPALLANTADKLGRRPVYILALLIYLIANIGLSFQNTYAGLLVLRMIQSAGSSGTISLGYGVISDITTPAERGLYSGVLLLGPNVAPPVGPVLGGVVATTLGWKWIFRLLCILGGACLVLIVLVFPETARAVVGNGSVPPTGIHRTVFSILQTNRDKAETEYVPGPKRRITFLSPLACLKLFKQADVTCVLTCNAIYYTIYCSVQASLSTLFIEDYGYKSLEAGLIYLPFGLACLVSTFTWGKLLNYDYARTARHNHVEITEANKGSSTTFQLEVARLRSSMYLVGITTVATIAYGWTVHYHIHVAVPLVLQAFIGFSITGLFVALGTLLTDLNPQGPSTAAATANIVRCAMAAVFLAVIQPIIDAVGAGWCFTIFGLLSGLCAPLLVWEMNRGCVWRHRRAARHAETGTQ